ncbi:L-ribulose-5-phosphate 4-epimerase [Vagococcus acidifermentans]|uniref:L-ribulose-5-phosphate 4-epimerase n=1 Tax=Vagococcus acidifermentans TaxID=564710 RepID=A0A430B2W2_9ENTE|nr:L-ribulose-5-phosphate 4-epimerase [Vagococcus acidifermentans]RSU14670.1 L-ribulose-5-phosphate 4-epimerase [Vagococcus acidifermentans]
MLKKLKEEVYAANMELQRQGLVKYTWGNASGFDEDEQVFVIKPSGVPYEELTPDDLVTVNLDGEKVDGKLNPSSDTATHAVIYKHFKEIKGVVHTHSPWATIWAQSGQELRPMGTTHADHFYGAIPCARYLTKQEIDEGYEKETGNLIVDTFKEKNIDPVAVPGILLHGHASFTWGKNVTDAVVNNVVLDEIAKMNLFARIVNPNASDLPQEILDKHYLRKHGANAYYGQN